MKRIIILCGPPGSGKSTLCETEYKDYIRISQDKYGKEGHMRYFLQALAEESNIIVDRMSFDKVQRNRYLDPAKKNGYETTIIVLHESSKTCLDRMLARERHETIQDEKSARSALHTFFTKYERVQDSEADEVIRVWPKGEKPEACLIDLDGTLANIDHRLHFVQGESKKDWKNFMYNIPGDSVNEWCHALINGMDRRGTQIVYCSGRGGENRGETKRWLEKHGLLPYCISYSLTEDGRLYDLSTYHENLYMRERSDSRADTIIKEIILDFEILTRFTPIFAVDDRPSVCRMWRSRDIVCLQCQDKEF